MSVYKRRDAWGDKWHYRKRVTLPDGSKVRIAGTPSVNRKRDALQAEIDHARRVIKRARFVASRAPGSSQPQKIQNRDGSISWRIRWVDAESRKGATYSTFEDAANARPVRRGNPNMRSGAPSVNPSGRSSKGRFVKGNSGNLLGRGAGRSAEKGDKDAFRAAVAEMAMDVLHDRSIPKVVRVRALAPLVGVIGLTDPQSERARQLSEATADLDAAVEVGRREMLASLDRLGLQIPHVSKISTEDDFPGRLRAHTARMERQIPGRRFTINNAIRALLHKVLCDEEQKERKAK